MNTEHIINIIQLGSIIIAGSLGIAGTITHTKDEKGNLTKWGIITVVGIMLSNSFSFIQTYLKQEKDQTDQIERAHKEQMKAKVDEINVKHTITLIENNIHKSDSALATQINLEKHQMFLQKQSGNVLKHVNEGLEIQNKTFEESKILNTQQKKATEDIETTLNPLIPFAIDVSFALTPRANTFFSSSSIFLNKQTSNEQEYLGGNPFSQIINGNDTLYLINSNYEGYNSLIERINFMNIVLSFTRIYKDGTLKTMKCEVPKNSINTSNIKDVSIIYSKTKNIYFIEMNNLPVKVLEYLGLGFNSTMDLQNASLNFEIVDAPAFISRPNIAFRFPPNYSKIRQLLIPHQREVGDNRPQKIYPYSNYSFTTPLSF